jgi:peroxiredoxin
MTSPAHNPNVVPANLPVPQDDGAWDHLTQPPFDRLPPEISLPSTNGSRIHLASLSRTVIFAYPRTGVPGQPPNLGFAGEDWDTIPGARGCTPQSCAFRDLHAEFVALGYRVFGLSTNTVEHQHEFKARQHVPFEFLSDTDLQLTRAMALPTFEFPVESGGPTTLLKRMAMVIEPVDMNPHAGASGGGAGSRIVKVFAPVFPPPMNAPTVLAWLRTRGERESHIRAAIAERRSTIATRLTIRPMSNSDRPLATEQFTRHFGSERINSRRQWIDTRTLPGLVAELASPGEKSRIAGLCVHTHMRANEECELVAIVSMIEGVGVGSFLLDACAKKAASAGCSRIFLTTSNDNLAALSLYQRRGWRLCNIYPGSLADARKEKPGIPTTGPSGIEIRDDLELEKRF